MSEGPRFSICGLFVLPSHWSRPLAFCNNLAFEIRPIVRGLVDLLEEVNLFQRDPIRAAHGPGGRIAISLISMKANLGMTSM